MDLPKSGLRLISREIRPGLTDLVGPYPYVMCRDWGAVAAEVRALEGAVAISFVADPFAAETVRAACEDWALCRPFKTHFVLDLAGDWRGARSKNTRTCVRKGYDLQALETLAADPSYAKDFWRLYQFTLGRRSVGGLARLSEQVLAQQLAVPGGYLTVARRHGAITGMMLSYLQRSHATAHLVAFDGAYLQDHVSYALIDAAAAYAEAQGARWLNIGGGAGGAEDPSDGLYQFKRRWTRTTRQALLCGKVLDRGAYQALVAETGDSAYFPAYRAPGGAYDWQPKL